MAIETWARSRLAAIILGVLGLSLAASLAPSSRAHAAPAGPPYNTFHFEEDRVQMRDGIHLDVGIWIPDVPAGVKVPVILTLTPYGILDYTPAPYDGTTLPDTQAQWFVPQGYARAFADVRGTRNSEGCYDYGGLGERHDGYDLVEWLGTRPWSSGKVGMVGTSYEGTTANAAAAEHPPHLAAIVPIAAINHWYGYAYQQGTRYYLNSEHATDEGIDTPAGFTYGFGIIPPFDPGGNPTNIVTRMSPCDRAAQDQHGYNTEPDYDQYFKDRDYLAAEAASGIPTWVVHGLVDNNVRTSEGTQVYEAATGPRKLWLGQWPHADGSSRSGPEWKRQMTAWWGKYLMGKDTGIDREPPVDVQLTNGKWVNESAWPPPTTAPLTLYPKAQTGSAGVLATRPSGSESDETIIDDPTLSENRMLQNPDMADPARLTYRGQPLTAPLRIAGAPYVDIQAASDMAGTHYALLLIDIDPTGKWNIAGRGFGNARYRDGLEQGKDLVSGQDYKFRVYIRDLDYVWPAGHSVGLVLSSSNSVWALADEYRATNTIHHGAGGRTTALVLPVVGPAEPAAISAVPAATPKPKPVLPNTAAGDRNPVAPWLILSLALLVGLAGWFPSGFRQKR